MIKSKRNILLGALLTFSISLYSQNKDSTQTSDSLYIPKSGIKVAYLGSLTYPGFKIGTELPLRIKYLTKDKSHRSKTIIKSQSLTINLGYYHQKTFHDNLFLTTEWQIRRQNAKGWFTEFSPGLGFSRTFIAATTYTVSDDGTVSVKKLAGYNYALVTVACGIGYDFYSKKKTPVKAYAKLTAIALYPYNNLIYPRPTIEFGVIYSPKSFLQTNSHLKIKHK